jgi:hypothetical protein
MVQIRQIVREAAKVVSHPDLEVVAEVTIPNKLDTPVYLLDGMFVILCEVSGYT